MVDSGLQIVRKRIQKETDMNTIIRATAKLVAAIRTADAETLKEAEAVLQKFGDSWLVEGDQKNLEGAGECCLSDTDVTEALKGAIGILAESRD